MKPYCVIATGLANEYKIENVVVINQLLVFCKDKYPDCRDAMHNFNVYKSDENRNIFCDQKKVYKKPRSLNITTINSRETEWNT